MVRHEHEHVRACFDGLGLARHGATSKWNYPHPLNQLVFKGLFHPGATIFDIRQVGANMLNAAVEVSRSLTNLKIDDSAPFNSYFTYPDLLFLSATVHYLKLVNLVSLNLVPLSSRN